MPQPSDVANGQMFTNHQLSLTPSSFQQHTAEPTYNDFRAYEAWSENPHPNPLAIRTCRRQNQQYEPYPQPQTPQSHFQPSPSNGHTWNSVQTYDNYSPLLQHGQVNGIQPPQQTLNDILSPHEVQADRPTTEDFQPTLFYSNYAPPQDWGTLTRTHIRAIFSDQEQYDVESAAYTQALLSSELYRSTEFLLDELSGKISRCYENISNAFDAHRSVLDELHAVQMRMVEVREIGNQDAQNGRELRRIWQEVGTGEGSR